ncbi:hypothetical protein KY290_029464 [Solanum tuberosum]|uniref:Ninja-family protein n=1 Tax=Solanum tuberosum TaxID=4113 RepID=A0ABQ7UMU5_SOLTU|nr:hypothetical protein KY284_029375 [Solanum tuberosum]KAH0667316.1 hypothetical protein KY285_028522 [Solanum tuberosum]KAH0750232.1 hypothetical protein KY290_029464 [Solanum tuberosum]
MLELMKGDFDEDENGIGLSLSLSIGGNYTKKNDQVFNSDDKMLIEWQSSNLRSSECWEKGIDEEKLSRSSESNGSMERCSSTITKCQSSSPKGRSSSNVMSIKEEQDQKTEEKRNCGMIQLLSRMPCVSATGNGPNGKTINGLLCKYDNKMEINIVCVCHGKSFSPSQFVEHAGAVDLSQPLKHITVIPPLFLMESN